MKVRNLVVVKQGPETFGAHVPDLPGCAVVGETRDEVLEWIRAAIDFHIEGLRDGGQPVPLPWWSWEVVGMAAA